MSVIDDLVAEGLFEAVPADRPSALRSLDAAERHLAGATMLTEVYDAARKAALRK